MERRDAIRWACGTMLLAVVGTFGLVSSALAREDAADSAVERAQLLLPKRPTRILVLDTASQSPATRERLRHTEGFVMAGDPTIYLTKHGATLQEASKGPGVFDYVLATIIWHEMAHLAGADEARAQRAEEDLWRRFVVSQKADARRALPYLALLRQRRHRDAGATVDPRSLQVGLAPR